VRVLVTGGAGYIGSHAVRALSRSGHQPVVLDNLVYGHADIVQQALGVPLINGQVGDRQLIEPLLRGQHPALIGTPFGSSASTARAGLFFIGDVNRLFG
jgi:UDP-glucose 4-epimerase